MENRKNKGERLSVIATILLIIVMILPYLLFGLLVVKIIRLEEEIKELKAEQGKSLEIIWSDDDELGFVAPENEMADEHSTEERSEDEKDKITDEADEENIVDPYPGYRKVYLTFDDGPSTETDRILEILDRYDVKATFFVTGTRAVQYEEELIKIKEHGHTIANHSYSHEFKDIYASLEAFQEDYYKLNDFLEETTGDEVKIYRFPGGSGIKSLEVETRNEIFKWMKKEGIRHFDWNVSSGDGSATPPPAVELAQKCISDVADQNSTAVVLMHDSSAKQSTIEALPLIIEGISQLENTIFLPIDETTAKVQQRSLQEE